MPPTTPTEADILKSALQGAVAGINTSEPGTVVSYNPLTQTATIALSIKGASRDADGVITAYERPNIPNVPIAWPRTASGYGDTFPLASGDPVLVVFSSRSTDEWRTVTGTRHEPRDPSRRHALQDAIAIPGCGSPSGPLPVTAYAAAARVISAPELLLGSSLATQRVMLATLFETQLVTWLNALATFQAAIVSAIGTGDLVALAAAAVTFASAQATFVGAVTTGHGATTVKAI